MQQKEEERERLYGIDRCSRLHLCCASLSFRMLAFTLKHSTDLLSLSVLNVCADLSLTSLLQFPFQCGFEQWYRFSSDEKTFRFPFDCEIVLALYNMYDFVVTIVSNDCYAYKQKPIWLSTACPKRNSTVFLCFTLNCRSNFIVTAVSIAIMQRGDLCLTLSFCSRWCLLFLFRTSSQTTSRTDLRLIASLYWLTKTEWFKCANTLTPFLY